MIIILLGKLVAMKIEITGSGCAIWKDWSNRSGKPHAILAPGGEYTVVGYYAPYYKVKILMGKRKGKIGYVWEAKVGMKMGNIIILEEGVTFRTEPNRRKGTDKGVIFPGTKVKIIKKIINRYLIKGSVFNQFLGVAWVGVSRVQILK